jgi:hypothetical protein
MYDGSSSMLLQIVSSPLWHFFNGWKKSERQDKLIMLNNAMNKSCS